MIATTTTPVSTRHPLGRPSTLDERLRQARVRQHFSVSTENGPAVYFLLLIHAARDGDESLALAIHERLKRLGWTCYETALPERGGHP